MLKLLKKNGNVLAYKHEKLLEKYRTSWIKIKHLLNYLKIKIKKILN